MENSQPDEIIYDDPNRIQYDIPVVCAIIEKDGKILAARRNSEDSSNAGRWELPGGKVRPAETWELALIREIHEELDVLIYIEKQFCEHTHYYSEKYAIELTAYICEVVKGTIAPLEHQELRWVNAVEAAELDWTEADIPIIEKYFNVTISEPF